MYNENKNSCYKSAAVNIQVGFKGFDDSVYSNITKFLNFVFRPVS